MEVEDVAAAEEDGGDGGECLGKADHAHVVPILLQTPVAVQAWQAGRLPPGQVVSWQQFNTF